MKIKIIKLLPLKQKNRKIVSKGRQKRESQKQAGNLQQRRVKKRFGLSK